MSVPVSIHGHDISGNSATNQTILSADEGELFYDTTLKQLFVCQGAGVFVPVGSAGGLAAGAAGSINTVRKLLTAMTDATFTDLCTITVPNAVNAAGIRVTTVGALGDGDSAQMTQFHGAVSRIAGAATGCTFGAAITAGTNNGATANAALAVQASGMTGAVGAQQTFTVQIKVTKSAGSSANHVLVASVELLNCFGAGITIA